MSSIELELALVALGAMLSPTTLSFSVLALVLGERPLRTGAWFYAGAFGVTLVIGVLAAFVLGNAAAAKEPSTPKTWVAILDLSAGALILVYVARMLPRPPRPERTAMAIERMSQVASSPAVVMLAVAPEPTKRTLHAAREWLERRARRIAAILLVLLATSLLSHGVAGVAS